METSKNTNLINPKLTKPFEYRLEEALSLRDLPLNSEISNSTITTEDHREPSTEFFEFLTSTSYDVSPAENIISGGKIIPLNNQTARSESLPVNRNVGLKRTSRSLNHCNLSRGPNTVHSQMENSYSAKTTVKAETASFGSGKSVKPRWYVIMFGMVKFSPEIEFKDIKNRQVRRNIPPVMIPSPSPSPSWRFLNALSCKEPTSVAATAPF